MRSRPRSIHSQKRIAGSSGGRESGPVIPERLQVGGSHRGDAPGALVTGPPRGQTAAMTIYDIPLKTLSGGDASLQDHAGKALLIVNVASQCGLTPQYAGLEELQKKYADRGFSVLGFPCNQFLGQEPGSAEEIATFCSVNYGVSFPLYEKLEVNGDDQHPLYAQLNQVADADGHSGDIRWNFEKFLVSPSGDVTRFSPVTVPEDPTLVDAIEGALPS